MNQENPIEWYLQHNLPLFRCVLKDKVPIKNEHWNNGGLPAYSLKDFVGFNVGVRLGEKCQDGYLNVCDIDPRNGGLETWKALEEKYGSMPLTRVVKTGGDGWHYYFLSRRKLKKCKLGPGVDFQGSGSYVIGAGSVHKNGKPYVFDLDVGIDLFEFMPEWLEDLVEQHTQNVRELYNSDIDETGKPLKVEKGMRDDYLISKAGHMRKAGMDEEDIFVSLRDVWNRRCEPPKSEKDLRRLAKSAFRYEPKAEPVDSSTNTEEPKQKQVFVTARQTTKKQLSQLFSETDGLVKELAKTILESAQRPYEHFAMASAFAIVSGVAQCGFSLPRLTGDTCNTVAGKPNDSLSLNQWCIAPPGSGKGAYIKAVEAALTMVDNRLVSAKFGSSYGLRASLFCLNAITAVIDEMQDEMAKLASSVGSPLYQILTDIKELFNNLPRLKPVGIKTSRYPSIICPRLSIFSAGTTGGFEKHLTGDTIGGGFMSRFLVWPFFGLTEFNYEASEHIEFTGEQIECLTELFRHGQTEAGKLQDPEDIYARLMAYLEKPSNGAVEHVQQVDPLRHVMQIEPEAVLELKKYRAKCDQVYRSLVDADMDGDLSPASIVARSPQYAFRLAGVHAAGCLTNKITLKDVKIGVGIADCLFDEMRYSIFGNAAESDFERNCNKVLRWMRKQEGKTTKTKLNNGVGRRLGKHVGALDACLVHLIQTGQLVAEDARGTVQDHEGSRTLLRGLTFYLPTGA